MTLAIKDKEEIILFQRKGSPTISDLEGLLYFSYKEKDLEDLEIFIKNLKKIYQNMKI